MNRNLSIALYEKRFVPFLYDCLIFVMFLPFGGIGNIRRETVNSFIHLPRKRVLEAGCGTGSMTKFLYESGCIVSAFDGSEKMLKRASSKVPNAKFSIGFIENYESEDTFDFVVFAFVLHELDEESRENVLEKYKRNLRPGGKIVILDHSVPKQGNVSRFWKWFLLKLEPPSVRICVENGYGDLLERLGFRVSEVRTLAAGTATYWIAEPESVQ
ncbi:class I SAM-dependent methyltransferase [Leptospira gomenensis]|uniref:Class I SAM-dependent methyltransferase n=1 Tax=Leptospira gomenensis TaxID=2484974 RepID=A0A5F1Z0V3_9LEPT|nr:class I SAM-dependent methyltransferase [Leptospira gomenensis]TGK35444.1 class I SAM-dependent methyltransferase [Leptospira gomenensis]TGK40664.1 class I SAM-dependent methyltransferase [Leptospira gomenensis]TGK46342.1 class I SAM-dependent methyltransferase [Leptospira gomenensis]TGK66477.1 class I SAM-dependent methyltransferase [Leptospira gomenensis]